jgi:hypothetical protein
LSSPPPASTPAPSPLEDEETKEAAPIPTTTIIPKNYYLTDGVFCSFNCTAAYINDNKHNRLYNESHILLNRIYNKITSGTAAGELRRGIELKAVFPAPHWRTLKEYGGHLTIKQFRDSFGKLEYEMHGTTNLHADGGAPAAPEPPKFHSVVTLFEKTVKF